MKCSNNLRQIGRALHVYHETYGTFPPAHTSDQEGRPLHSWRTLILPYLDQRQLYDQIRLDEPWNSTYNRKFVEIDLPVYACPKEKSRLAYFAVVTAGSIFESPSPHSLAEITDGTSNTIMVIEVLSRTNSWMQPIDFDQQELNKVLAGGLVSAHPGGSQALLADGSVRFIGKTVGADAFQAVLTRNGTETIRNTDWE